MANKYSSLYVTPADQPNGPRSYKGPVPERSNSTVCAVALITGAFAAADVLYLRRMTAGEILFDVGVLHSAAGGPATADLVLRPTDGTADIVIAANSTALAGATNTGVSISGMALNQVPDDGKTYDLCWIADALGTAVTHTHIILTAVP